MRSRFSMPPRQSAASGDVDAVYAAVRKTGHIRFADISPSKISLASFPVFCLLLYYITAMMLCKAFAREIMKTIGGSGRSRKGIRFRWIPTYYMETYKFGANRRRKGAPKKMRLRLILSNLTNLYKKTLVLVLIFDDLIKTGAWITIAGGYLAHLSFVVF